MSLDRSLKVAGNLSRHRNVLNRTERIAKLTDKGIFKVGQSDPVGLPKVGNRKVVQAKAKKETKAAESATAAAPAAGAPAEGAAPAAAAAPAAKAGAGKKEAKK